MTLDSFINTYNGKFVDVDHAYGGQLDVPVKLFGRFPSFYGLLKVSKIPKKYTTVFNFDSSRPLLITGVPSYSFDSRCIISSKSPIAKISGVSADSKIDLAIIEGILINMVNIFTGRRLNNQSMKINQSLRSSFLQIKLVSIFSYIPLPTTITKSFKNLSSFIVQNTCKLAIPLADNFFIHISKSNQLECKCL